MQGQLQNRFADDRLNLQPVPQQAYPQQPLAGVPSLSNRSSLFSVAQQSASSSNIFAKLSWVIIVLIIFIIILRITVVFLSYLFNKTKSPHIIDGMVAGNEGLIFPQDPTASNAKVISVSSNQPGGIEFSWSLWIIIDETQSNTSSLMTIFTKGDGKAPSVTPSLVNSPGLFLVPNTNSIQVTMNVQGDDVTAQNMTIQNMPYNKWIHIVIRCSSNIIDVYINGIIADSMTLNDSFTKQNFGCVYEWCYS